MRLIDSIGYEATAGERAASANIASVDPAARKPYDRIVAPVASAVLMLSMLVVGAPAAADDRLPFDEWLQAFRAEALARGIRPEVVEQALTNVQRIDVVVERDQNQAEFILSLDAYLTRRLTRELVTYARRMAVKHRRVLRKVSAAYGVPAETLVSVWGLESNFGRFSGVRPTIPTLATLAYEPRRSGFFRNELFAALEILNRGDIEVDAMKGSWAGAMGQPQFLPSVYLRYAVDFDRDRHRDIWTSLPDILASIANYLKEHGWNPKEAWGREVRIPSDKEALATAAPPREAGCTAVKNMSEPLSLRQWQQLGVRLPKGGRLPVAKIRGSLVQAGSRSFLAYGNYEALLAYNCAHTYAITVGLLSDYVSGRLSPPRPPQKAKARGRKVVKRSAKRRLHRVS
ncbi:MAG: lytic murein transglycosylase [Acidobacteria bacterium]|nr:lytic murein transglycosylase [Acidobacteriota bacterium]